MTDCYELILVAKVDDVPADLWMKRLLKMLLRAYKFRCKSVRRIETEQVRKAA